jgi:hypothetical protein
MARKIAPSEPTEADSVGVATPAMIEPSTAAISVNGGTSAITTRRPRPARSSADIWSAGADCGSRKARIMIHTM